ncbi:hypothetical protein SNOG_14438 [Parastagonospora nodorum SN15]|uniref:Uncharacterized protein n=1 Tax=Phaeosphaeria nodorum (strain SN15 / ATCC MYA-4574 / FGSC 10173) TaxID=321614 RepID=Q0U1Q7_PHANO|nr:hypothetical protein SNOG_14438 [Parastagonospora nodorum SN15]EAT78309.1 hypothetical protein SNOG_14438 [Parastagonospora nodorum SN15]
MHRMYDDVSVRVSWLSSQYRGSAMSSAKSGEGPNE